MIVTQSMRLGSLYIRCRRQLPDFEVHIERTEDGVLEACASWKDHPGYVRLPLRNMPKSLSRFWAFYFVLREVLRLQQTVDPPTCGNIL